VALKGCKPDNFHEIQIKTNKLSFSKVTSTAPISRAELAPKQICMSNTHQTKDSFQSMCSAMSQPMPQTSKRSAALLQYYAL